MNDLYEANPQIAQTRKIINTAFGSYLRVCRSGGMPTDLSKKVQASYDQFASLYLGEALANAALLQGQDWEPIATAPTDTDEALLLYAENVGWEFFVCKFIDGHWRTLDSDFDPFIKGLSQPTHWRRLRGPIPDDLIDRPRTEAEELKLQLRTIAVLANSTSMSEEARLKAISKTIADLL